MRGSALGGDSDEEYESSLEPTSGFYGKRIKAKMNKGQRQQAASTNGSSSSQSSISQNFSMLTAKPSKSRLQYIKEGFRKAGIFLLTNIFMSVLLLVIGIVLSLGPGLHSLLVLDPPPTIDKSLNAFNIPNHIVSRRQDALEVAKNPKLSSRSKRDIFEHPNSDLVPDFSHVHVPSYHELLSRDIVEPVKSYFLKGNEPTIDIMDMSAKEPSVRRIRRSVLRENIKESVMRAYSENSAEEEETSDLILNREKRNVQRTNKIRGLTQAFRTWKMQLVYLAVSGSEPNVFTRDNIEHINQVETNIKDHPGFTDFCYINYMKWGMDRNLDRYQGCAPLNSLMTYFYPSLYNGKIQYDGLGQNQEPIDTTLRFAMTRDTFFWYVDDKINKTYQKSRLLRTEVQFGSPILGKCFILYLLILYFMMYTVEPV